MRPPTCSEGALRVLAALWPDPPPGCPTDTSLLRRAQSWAVILDTTPVEILYALKWMNHELQQLTVDLDKLMSNEPRSSTEEGNGCDQI